MVEFFYHRLLVDPLVTVVTSGENELWPGVVYTNIVSQGNPADVFISLNWHLEDHLPHIIEITNRAKAQFPNLRFTILASAEEEEALARSREIDVFLCNHNCFLDERLIYPEPNAPKIYDAVYNGRIAPFKRFELAAQTTRLAIITGGYELDKNYASKILNSMHDLAFCNYRPRSGVVGYMTVEQVRRTLVQSWCGLALSAAEGAMYASGEYLLAGIPVVTTASRGGRDLFFHTDYVTTVEETPQAVAAAVANFKERRLDPIMVRNRTLALFREHRRRLILRLSEILQSDLLPLADGSMWLPLFRHQMRTRLRITL